MALEYFPDTRSDLLRRLASTGGEGEQGDESNDVIKLLCERYREAIRLWMLRRGLSETDADDVTHDFIHRWLSVRFGGNFESRGKRFREYLSVCLGHFLAERARAGARLKRGGGQAHVPLEEVSSEPFEDPTDSSMDMALAWQVFARVLRDMLADGNGLASAAMLRKVALCGTAVPYPELAQELGISLSLVKVRVLRIRSEFRERFRREILLMCPDAATADIEEVTLREILLRSDPAGWMEVGSFGQPGLKKSQVD
jgi:DNA-directed RNA polymerase specialized sigma24 family protein